MSNPYVFDEERVDRKGRRYTVKYRLNFLPVRLNRSRNRPQWWLTSYKEARAVSPYPERSVR